MQQLGGWTRADVIRIMEKGAKLQPVTIDAPGKFLRLLDMKETPALNDPSLPEGWVNFYRLDDYAAVGYFYLDKPSSNLPALAPVAVRVAGL
ncbi:MAG: hypothetical protein EOO88_62660 [Pedobacter sp.]|nr:MAG: hypothetical protein EOO88_62660 [Pedobacter sp.]